MVKKEIEEILQTLIENQGEKLSIRKISLLRKINYKSAYMALKKLEKEEIAKLEKIGNTTLCSLIPKEDHLIFLAECQRREKLLKNSNFRIIHSRLNKINCPFIALLFGSAVKGIFAPRSDIDLLIVTENQKEIEREISLMPLKIHATMISFKEFEKMAKSREFNVVSEAMKRNIILIGIEDYYRMLENAK